MLQSWVDLTEVRWHNDTRTLSGTAHVIGGEPFKIVVANNGVEVLTSEAQGGLSCLTLSATANTNMDWILKYA